MENKLVICNLFGGPGVGKSTTRADIFASMNKATNLGVEEVYEYAKDLVWADRIKELENQIQILAKQYTRQHRLVGKVNVAVTDSPLLLSIIYSNEFTPKSLETLTLELWNQFDNLNYFLTRNPEIPYDPNGRNQTEEEARQVDQDILTMLHYRKFPYTRVMVDTNTTDTIISDIIRRLQDR